MIQINLTYQDPLNTTATHQPSGAQLQTDAPKDNQGKGESFSPTDLLATSLGACMLTLIGIAARPRNISLNGLKAMVEKHMVADPQRRVGKLVVDITMPKNLSEKDRNILEHAARTCPVSQSLSPKTEVVLTFHYPEKIA